MVCGVGTGGGSVGGGGGTSVVETGAGTTEVDGTVVVVVVVVTGAEATSAPESLPHPANAAAIAADAATAHHLFARTPEFARTIEEPDPTFAHPLLLSDPTGETEAVL